MKTFRTACQFGFLILACCVLFPLLAVYIVGDWLVRWVSLVKQGWIECGKHLEAGNN